MLNVIIGLIGLGLIVTIHELGHFLAAKAFGITVEAFSVGWGPKLLGFTKNGTEYRLSALPIGGYCRMKGENQFRKALEENLDAIPAEEGSLYSVSPVKRLITYLAGPLFNLIFAVLTLSLIHGIGYNIYTYPNRIVLASEIQSGAEYPSDRAGLETGDIITEIGGSPTPHYQAIQRIVSQNPEKELSMTVSRDGGTVELSVTPDLNKDTGGGFLGVIPWVAPVVSDVRPDSGAAIAGLKSGDRILEAGGTSIAHQGELLKLLDKAPRSLLLRVDRNGTPVSLELIPHYSEETGYDLGFVLSHDTIPYRAPGVFGALRAGWEETWSTLGSSIRGFGMMFRGLNLNKALSGPLKITYMVGQITAAGFSQTLWDGFTAFFRFLSLISVVLFFMNLLPIPALDGGMILAGLWEMIRKKPLHPRKFYRYQMIGFSVIIFLALLVTFNDLLFFFMR